MRIFDEPNLSNPEWRCPICKTRNKKPVTLVGIYGTREGNTEEAEQVHVDCLELTMYPEQRVIAMKWG